MARYYLDGQGRARFNFGTHKTELVAETDRSYLRWILRNDFDEDLKVLCRRALGYPEPAPEPPKPAPQPKPAAANRPMTDREIASEAMRRVRERKRPKRPLERAAAIVRRLVGGRNR